MKPVVLYDVFGAWGLPSVSPFVLKLETWLRMAEVPYVRKPGNPVRAPLGKVPYVEIDGVYMGDSQLIIEALTTRNGVQLDGWLTPTRRATAHSLRRMLEEATYFHTVRFRWIEPDGWPVQVAAFSPHLPPLLGTLVLHNIRARLRKTVYLQGQGRHHRTTAEAQLSADVAAVETLIEGPLLFGESPCSADATLSAFLWQMQGYPVDHAPKRAASTPKLLAYVAEIRRRYWPEWTQAGLELAADGR